MIFGSSPGQYLGVERGRCMQRVSGWCNLTKQSRISIVWSGRSLAQLKQGCLSQEQLVSCCNLILAQLRPVILQILSSYTGADKCLLPVIIYKLISRLFFHPTVATPVILPTGRFSVVQAIRFPGSGLLLADFGLYYHALTVARLLSASQDGGCCSSLRKALGPSRKTP